MDFSGFSGHRPRRALVSSGRDLDAPKRGREDPKPKTRMLGVTPIIFCKVDARDARETPGCWPSDQTPPQQVSLATPQIFIYMVGAKDDKEKIVSRV